MIFSILRGRYLVCTRLATTSSIGWKLLLLKYLSVSPNQVLSSDAASYYSSHKDRACVYDLDLTNGPRSWTLTERWVSSEVVARMRWEEHACNGLRRPCLQRPLEDSRPRRRPEIVL